MMKKVRAAAVALLAGSMLAGCGVTLNSGAMRGQNDGFGPGASQDMVLEREAQSLGMPSTGMSGMHGPMHQFLRRGAAKLGLTDDQQQQLKKIAQAKAGDRARHRADFQKHRAELKGLLMAAKVDEVALRSFIAARQKDAAGHVASAADALAQMRAVLTEKQRTDLVAMLENPTANQDFGARRRQAHDRFKPRLEAFRKSLDLTADQSAAIDALKQKVVAVHKDAQPRMKQAFISFLKTGDKAALVKAMQEGVTGRVPTDELVKVASVLDKDQRTKLVEHFGKARKHLMPGKPGKPGKHGFHHGALTGSAGEV